MALCIGQTEDRSQPSNPVTREVSVVSELNEIEDDEFEDDHVEPASGKYLFLAECPDGIESCFLKAWKVSGKIIVYIHMYVLSL